MRLSRRGHGLQVQFALEAAFLAQLLVGGLRERLVRIEDKLIQLFDPPFDRGVLQPGYIKGYVPGLRENGVKPARRRQSPRIHGNLRQLAATRTN